MFLACWLTTNPTTSFFSAPATQLDLAGKWKEEMHVLWEEKIDGEIMEGAVFSQKKEKEAGC